MEPEAQKQQEPQSEPSTPASAPVSAEAATGAQPSEAPFYKRNQTAIAITIAVLILLGAGYYVYTNNYMNGDSVATVNGKHISRKEFDDSVALMEQSATAQGIDLSDESVKKEIRDQALTVLVNNALLITAAEGAGFAASDAEIDEKYQELVTQVGGEEELTKRMGEIGLTSDKLRNNIRERILADRYIESVTDIENVAVTDEEVSQFLSALDTGDTELPPAEEIRPQIEAEILGQKQQQIVADLIETLRAEATIDTEM